MQYLNKPVAAICLAVASAFVQAQDATYEFNIPAQSASQVINALSKQTGLQPFFAEDSVKGLQSPGVKGKFSLREALDKALAGTGLSYQFTAEKAVAIKASPVEKAANFPTIEIRDTSLENSYTVLKASTGTKTDTPLKETPLSIQVVNNEALSDQGVTSLSEAIKNVSGVLPAGGGGEYDLYQVRGFVANPTRYRDGHRIPNGTFDFANIDSVEVLKGPASMLYGRLEPGGIVNVITKKPQAERSGYVEFQVGSYDFYRTAFGATGAANDAKTLLYRIDGAFSKSDSFQDFSKDRMAFLAPSFSLRPSDATEINLSLEIGKRDYVPRMGHPAVGRSIVDVPISRNYSQPGFNQDQTRHTLVDLNFTHQFSTDWKVSGGFTATKYDYDFRDAPIAYAQFLLPDQVRRGIYFEDFERKNQSGYLDLTGKFITGNIKHELLIGADHHRETTRNQGWWSYAELWFGGGADYFTAVDVNNTVYPSMNAGFFENLRKTAPNDFGKASLEWRGFYVQDQMRIAERWHVLAGGRYDTAETKSGSIQGDGLSMADVPITGVKQSKFSPRLGVMFDITPATSVYGNYVESFGADTSRDINGAPLEPEAARQYELGVKTQLAGDRLIATAALFDIVKKNLRGTDPVDGVSAIILGKARSRGFEFDLSGRIGEHWSVIGHYAYTDAELIEDKFNGTEGNRLPNTPRQAFGLWTKYAFSGNSAFGWSVGGGLWRIGKRVGDIENTYDLDAYTRIDAFVAYKAKTAVGIMTTQLNVANLTDTRYYYAAPMGNTSVAHNWAGDPRTIKASVRFDF